MINNLTSQFVPVNYDDLPKYAPKKKSETVKKVLKFVASFLPIVAPLFKMVIVGSVKSLLSLKRTRLSPKAKEDLSKLDIKVKELAKKVGLTPKERDKLKIIVEKDLSLGAAAAGYIPGQEVVLLNPLYILNPEDLPDDLKLETIRTDEDFDEWLPRFQSWMYNEYLENPDIQFKSQHEYDQMKEHVRGWVKLAKEHNLEDAKDFVLGHELAHIKHKHTLTSPLFELACHILVGAVSAGAAAAICILFPEVPIIILSVIAAIALSRAMLAVVTKISQAVSRVHEKQADMTSAKKIGKEESGMEFFQVIRNLQLRMRKRYDRIRTKISPEGNNRLDHDHPPLTDRIHYLSEYRREAVV